MTHKVIVLVAAAATTLGAPPDAVAAQDVPPTPYAILSSTLLDPPPLAPIPACIPVRLALQAGNFDKSLANNQFEEARELLSSYAKTIAIQSPEDQVADLEFMRAVLAARSARSRDQRMDARAELAKINQREKDPERLVCSLLETARLSIAVRRFPEVDAALSRIVKSDSTQARAPSTLEAVRFMEAEVLYRRKDAFNAHIAYRELASSSNPRMAAAARLRLTDLSFDAGKSRSVLLEYETLLPHGEAFGANAHDWSLRAAEAAMDIRDFPAANSWFERYLSQVQDRDVRDIVEIRRADLDSIRGKPDDARKRLRKLWRRKGDVNIENLARLRQIDLGVGTDDPEARIAILHETTASHNRGVKIYGLSVLVHELLLQGKLDEGVAAITRLTYEGADPVLARHFERDLDQLLARTAQEAEYPEGCGRVVRRLGGRYGILLRVASDASPFFALGACFEERKLHDSAIALYRSLARAFGSRLASQVALPLARASLDSGDVALARAAAEANIRHGGEQMVEWKVIAADAEAALGHPDAAREILRSLLQKDLEPEVRMRLGLSLARLLGNQQDPRDVDLVVRAAIAAKDSAKDQDPSTFGELAMRAAAALREEDQLKRARPIYALASSVLPDGARKNEAHYWATGKPLESDEEGQDAEAVTGDPWSRLASYEAQARDMSDRYRLGSMK